MRFENISYASLVLIATIMYGINVHTVGRNLKEIGSIQIASVAFSFLILPSAAVLFFTGFFNYNELFSYPVTSSYYELYSLFEESSAQISVDHSNYSDFINFSSAEERLRNFKYKVDLVNKKVTIRPRVTAVLGYKDSYTNYFDTDYQAQAYVDELIINSKKNFQVIIEK
jgi:hypothetical protein